MNRNRLHLPLLLQLMVGGASLESGGTAQQTVMEEFKPGVEPVLTLHPLTVEQTAREMRWIRGLVTLTLVQVMNLIASKYHVCTSLEIIFRYKVTSKPVGFA